MNDEAVDNASVNATKNSSGPIPPEVEVWQELFRSRSANAELLPAQPPAGPLREPPFPEDAEQWRLACKNNLALIALGIAFPGCWAYKLGRPTKSLLGVQLGEKGWQQRYFVFARRFIFYFKKDTPRSKTEGCIYLYGCRVKKIGPQPGYRYCIKITPIVPRKPDDSPNMDASFTIGLTDESKMEWWVNYIRQASGHNLPGRPPAKPLTMELPSSHHQLSPEHTGPQSTEIPETETELDNVRSAMNKLLETGWYSDTNLVGIPSHRFVLGSRSPQLLSSEVASRSQAAVKQLLTYCYTDTVNVEELTWVEMMDLAYLAQFCDMKRLYSRVAMLIQAQLKANTVFLWLALAHLRNVSAVKRACIDFIHTHKIAPPKSLASIKDLAFTPHPNVLDLDGLSSYQSSTTSPSCRSRSSSSSAVRSETVALNYCPSEGSACGTEVDISSTSTVTFTSGSSQEVPVEHCPSDQPAISDLEEADFDSVLLELADEVNELRAIPYLLHQRYRRLSSSLSPDLIATLRRAYRARNATPSTRCDLTLQISPSVGVPAHRAIVCVRSSILLAKLNPDNATPEAHQTVDVRELFHPEASPDAEAVEAWLRYLYYGDVDVKPLSACLLATMPAVLAEHPRLRDVVVSKLMECATERDCCISAFLASHTLDIAELRKTSLSAAATYWNELRHSEELELLPKGLLLELLKEMP
eukprot:TRINITY_DN5696_c0_g1_i1.p1 TRINITY_DN5696_c0_g1~~TRINITY_DN5696_c0_g1_i1.p1  ORF type:complete len:737 (-),score=92.07 TRINITY_DN5696_c0_g1_i1:967-3060(-)